MQQQKPIPMKTVKSSQVAAHGYDPLTQTLAVQFNSGGVYHYSGVPQDTADALAKAESVGSFIGKHIKGKHEFKKQDATLLPPRAG